uniref:Uncharacterized protein n=1 Tax=Lepeophtheirus salmonis TaxID=72036 RepID=A0A0K2SVP3_LEPSM
MEVMVSSSSPGLFFEIFTKFPSKDSSNSLSTPYTSDVDNEALDEVEVLPRPPCIISSLSSCPLGFQLCLYLTLREPPLDLKMDLLEVLFVIEEVIVKLSSFSLIEEVVRVFVLDSEINLSKGNDCDASGLEGLDNSGTLFFSLVRGGESVSFKSI